VSRGIRILEKVIVICLECQGLWRDAVGVVRDLVHSFEGVGGPRRAERLRAALRTGLREHLLGRFPETIRDTDDLHVDEERGVAFVRANDADAARIGYNFVD